MGKTYKDTANYHRFHNTDGPTDPHVKDKLGILSIPSKCCVSLRSGHRRKSFAKDKVFQRRIDRAKSKCKYDKE